MKREKQHVTIHDLARELGISGSTVSRALHNNPRISTATRKQVQELAASYNFYPNSMASSLRKGKGNTIGVIVPNINRSFFSNIIGGVEEILSQSGYNLMICQSHEMLQKEKNALLTLMNARVDGIIMSLSMETDTYDHIESVLKRGVRMVFFDRIPDTLQVQSVVINDYVAAYKLTENLIEQGYQKPAHIAGSANINVYANRKQGFIDALKKKGMPVDNPYIVEAEMTRQGGAGAFRRLMELPVKPDAMVCSGDLAAHGVLLAARQTGVDVPGELAITGFANEEFTPHVSPPLTSVDQRGSEIGRKAANLFLADEPASVKRQLMIEPNILFRESSMRSVSIENLK
ncbi:MAG: LacI family DNA-binding transcriptional regulator [Bacteroidales bacterium]